MGQEIQIRHPKNRYIAHAMEYKELWVTRVMG